MILTRWQKPQNWTLSPFRRVTNLHDDVEQLVSFALGPLLGSRATQDPVVRGPAVDLYEDKDAVTVQAELPGLKKEDIKVNLEDGYLTISGERKQEKPENSEPYQAERFRGRFERVISIPSEVDADKIKATYTDGILTVTLPKSEQAKPKQIPINVN
jgi:HSP20 family protein